MTPDDNRPVLDMTTIRVSFLKASSLTTLLVIMPIIGIPYGFKLS